MQTIYNVDVSTAIAGNVYEFKVTKCHGISYKMKHN